MRVKTFEAASMQDALAVVKKDMGEDAFILSTRTKRRKSLLGEETYIEVTAAVDEAAAPTPAKEPAKEQAKASGIQAGTYALRDPLATRALVQPVTPPQEAPARRVQAARVPAPAPAPPAPAPAPPPPPMDLQPIRRELLEIKGTVEALREMEARNQTILGELDQMKAQLSRIQKQGMPQAQLHLPQALLELYGDLVGNDVDPFIALRLCEYTQRSLLDQSLEGPLDPERARIFLRRVISDFIPVAPPIQLEAGRTRVVALVGPTGVGKTTTIAKLAAYAKLELKQKVALLTLDTFRIAAVDQLHQYSEILQVPLHVALTVEDLRSALRFYQDRALVLIDTPGHSPKDAEMMAQLRRFLDELPDVEVHLVLSATTKPRDLADIAQRFESLRPTRLCFTKLDETSTLGPVLSTLVRVKRPLSYLGTGQEVPQDLEMATSRRLADLILPLNPRPADLAESGPPPRPPRAHASDLLRPSLTPAGRVPVAE